MVAVVASEPTVILKVFKDLEVMDAVELRNEIARILSESEVFRVIVDLSAARRIGPRGIALLVDERAQVRERGGELRVVAPGHEELHGIFTVFPTVDAAVRA